MWGRHTTASFVIIFQIIMQEARLIHPSPEPEFRPGKITLRADQQLHSSDEPLGQFSLYVVILVWLVCLSVWMFVPWGISKAYMVRYNSNYERIYFVAQLQDNSNSRRISSLTFGPKLRRSQQEEDRRSMEVPCLVLV